MTCCTILIGIAIAFVVPMLGGLVVVWATKDDYQ